MVVRAYCVTESDLMLGHSLRAAFYQCQCIMTEPPSVLRERVQSTLAVTVTVACDCALCLLVSVRAQHG